MSNKKLTEGIRGAKEGVAECYTDAMSQSGQGEQMSVTISMPGKNISVTTDSADEIGNILRLAGINVGDASAEPEIAIAVEPGAMGGEAPEAELPPMGAQTMGQQPPMDPRLDVDGDGDHDMQDHELEAEQEAEPDVEEGSGVMHFKAQQAKADGKDSFKLGDEEFDVEEAAGDVSRTSKGGTVTQTSTGQVHKAGPGNYGGSDDDHDDDTPVPAGAVPEKEDEVDESARILQLAGVTNEAQSAAQKAAFKAMIDKKNGKSEDKADDNAEADDEEKVEEATDAVPAAGNVYGQGVYEGQQEYSRILALAGINEWANSPQGKADDKGTTFDKLPSKPGQGSGSADYGQNRANGQGENPMGRKDVGVEEAFEIAMGEYRKFVSESITDKK